MADCTQAKVLDIWGGDELGSQGPSSAVMTEGVYTAVGVLPHETVLLRMTPAAATSL